MKLFAPLAALVVANVVTATTNTQSQHQQHLRNKKPSNQDVYQRSSHTNSEGERQLQDTMSMVEMHEKTSFSLPWETDEEEAKTNISECIISVNQSQVDQFIELAEKVDASTMTFIPSAPAISNFVIGNENLTNPALAVFEDGQPKLSNKESFQWFSNILPTRYDENRVCTTTSDLIVYPFDPPQNISVCSLPPSEYPSPEDPNFETEMLTPYIHQSPNASKWGYQKFGSGLVTEACLAPYIGLDLDEIVSDSIHTSIFAMNHENRGSNNERKRQYMTALTCDKMQFYVPQIQDALNDTIETLRANPEIPLLSTWAHNLDILSLDLHLGKVDHPQYVIDYVKRLNNATSSLPTGCGDLESQDNIKSALCEVEHVEAYFHERVQAIVADKDQSTFVFWWYKAGMCVEETAEGEVYMKCLTQEILHNIFAFALYVTATFLVITAKVVGRVVTENIFEGVVEPLSDTKLDFFQLYADATDDDRLDIIRETWRQLLPNNAWVSSHQTSEGMNDGTDFSDMHDYSRIMHIPFMLQAMNDGYSYTSGDTTAYEYTPESVKTRYEDFQPSSDTAKCPFLQSQDNDGEDDQFLLPSNFTMSPIDDETVIPAGHEKLIPVYDTSQYCPFGLGHRRCPAEMLHMTFMDEILNSFKGLEFEVRGDGIDLNDILNGVPCNEPNSVASGPPGCREDNIFVVFHDNDDDQASTKEPSTSPTHSPTQSSTTEPSPPPHNWSPPTTSPSKGPTKPTTRTVTPQPSKAPSQSPSKKPVPSRTYRSIGSKGSKSSKAKTSKYNKIKRKKIKRRKKKLMMKWKNKGKH